MKLCQKLQTIQSAKSMSIWIKICMQMIFYKQFSRMCLALVKILIRNKSSRRRKRKMLSYKRRLQKNKRKWLSSMSFKEKTIQIHTILRITHPQFPPTRNLRSVPNLINPIAKVETKSQGNRHDLAPRTTPVQITRTMRHL